MDDLNQVVIAGRLTRDPHLRTTRNGTTICSLRIACNKMFFNIKVWGDPGRELATSAIKGDVIQVEGRLDWYEWSPGDGPRREYVGVVANDTPGSVQCISSAPRTGAVTNGDPLVNGFPAINGAMAVQGPTSTIVAQGQQVDYGIPALGGAAPGMIPTLPAGAMAQPSNFAVAPPAPDPQDAPPAAPISAAIAQQFDPAAALAALGGPSSPQPQGSGAPVGHGFAASMPPAIAATQTPTPAPMTGAPAASVTLPPIVSLPGTEAGQGAAPAVQITAQAFAPSAPEITFAQPDTAAFAEHEEGGAVALADPDEISLAELGHDPNEALAMDPEEEIVEEDSRFL
jgi:single-stranded DNA-binding protein